VNPTSAVAVCLALAGSFFLYNVEASAQDCVSGSNITGEQMNTLLNNRYACIGTSPAASWNELHDQASGKVLDFKKGPKDPRDPSDTPAHPTGIYTIIGVAGPESAGIVTYTYGSAETYGYNIRANLGSSTPAPGIYSFCTSTGGQNLAVTVSTGPC
jgi:hypothetical protein